MKKYFIKQIAAIGMAITIAATPVTTYASTVLTVGSKGNQVEMIQTALQKLGYFTYSKSTGYYGDITKSAVQNFQKDAGITADGIVGDTTLGLLMPNVKALTKASLKKMANNTTNEYNGDLDWFSQVINIWKRGMNAVITDVDTGKSFEVKRTYGSNHADVEALTKEDTKIIKEIWDGFSWERRAVVVVVGDYTLAGSMTGMPHAGLDKKPEGTMVYGRSSGYGYGYNFDSVKENGMDGHMDIHFKNSKTHGTGVVQKVQQDMVKKAAEYIADIKSEA